VFRATQRTGKHSEPVWQVCWQRSEGHEVMLCSISTDGRVAEWSFAGSEMQMRDVLQLSNLRERKRLPLSMLPAAHGEAAAEVALASGGADQPAESKPQPQPQAPPPQPPQQQQEQGQQQAVQQLGGSRSSKPSEDEGGEQAVGIAGGLTLASGKHTCAATGFRSRPVRAVPLFCWLSVAHAATLLQLVFIFFLCAGGCCFDFHREQQFLFVVGAEDGSLYKCSTAFTTEFLQVCVCVCGGGGGGRGHAAQGPQRKSATRLCACLLAVSAVHVH
jgi:hypothetical protein